MAAGRTVMAQRATSQPDFASRRSASPQRKAQKQTHFMPRKAALSGMCGSFSSLIRPARFSRQTIARIAPATFSSLGESIDSIKKIAQLTHLDDRRKNGVTMQNH
jgi:hypothetical protein